MCLCDSLWITPRRGCPILIQKSSCARRSRVAPSNSAGLGQLPVAQCTTQPAELFRQDTRSKKLVISCFVQIRQFPQANAEEGMFAVKPRCPQEGLEDFPARTTIPQVVRVTTQATNLNSGEPCGKQLNVRGAYQVIDLDKLCI